MVRALAPLLSGGAGHVPADLRLAQARYLWQQADYERALPLYLSVLDQGVAIEIPVVAWFETARPFEELGTCGESLTYFALYLQQAPRDAPERGSAEWHYGNCLYRVAERDWETGSGRTAVTNLDRLIALGSIGRTT